MSPLASETFRCRWLIQERRWDLLIMCEGMNTFPTRKWRYSVMAMVLSYKFWNSFKWNSCERYQLRWKTRRIIWRPVVKPFWRWAKGGQGLFQPCDAVWAFYRKKPICYVSPAWRNQGPRVLWSFWSLIPLRSSSSDDDAFRWRILTQTASIVIFISVVFGPWNRHLVFSYVSNSGYPRPLLFSPSAQPSPTKILEDIQAKVQEHRSRLPRWWVCQIKNNSLICAGTRPQPYE